MLHKWCLLGLCVGFLMGCASEPVAPPKKTSSAGNEEAMWQKFQAEKADDKLDKEMESYRASKTEE